MKRLLIIIIVVIFLTTNAFAGEEIPLNGFLGLNYSSRVTGDDDYIIAEERLQLELAKESYDPLNASFFVKADFIKDELSADEAYNIDIREAYITLGFESIDLKFGRQITTWGTGDLLFINDLFPKNWE